MKPMVKFLSVSTLVMLASSGAYADNTSVNTISNNAIEQIQPASGKSTAPFGDFTTQAKAGECYGKVRLPAVTRTETNEIQVEPASKRIARIVPATYKTITEEVVVREATEKLVTIPATYKTVTQNVETRAASTRLIKIPAKYDTVSESILVSPARSVWKKGKSSPITRTNSQGEVMCLVDIPAVYKTIQKRVLISAETTREESVPGVTKTITRRVVDQPARVENRPIPAVYKTITKRILDNPEQAVYKDIPAKFRTVRNKYVVSPEKVTWEKILCQTNATTANVQTLQRALKQAGYNPGDIDGVLGYQTYKAVDAFQNAKGLSRGEITYNTLSALNIQM